MSTVIAERPCEPPALDDIIDFASQEELPAVRWLKKLGTDEPRRNIHSLDAPTVAVKRVVDVAIAGLGLVLLSPLLVLVAALVKCSSRGPVIFEQTRVGLNLRDYGDRRAANIGPPVRSPDRRNPAGDRRGEFTYGRHFTLYKFRTMRIDAEANGPQFGRDNDPRITPLGRFLRKTRLDELPQLWNVLKGEMTLVGPRPERPEFMEQLSDRIPGYLQRLGLKPGITGVAQVVNGYDKDMESFQRKVAFDMLYLQNCSLQNDLKILIRTLGIVLTGKGAL